MSPEDTASQQIALMGCVGETCEKQVLVPPAEVNVVEVGGSKYDFEYSPEYDEVDLPLAPMMLPAVLSFTDREGHWGGTAAIGLCTNAGMEKARQA